MQYVNFVHGNDGQPVMYTARVAVTDTEYVRRIATTLQPMSDEDYMNGPAVVLHTMAKSSYVFDGVDLYWLIEWNPGLIVLRLSPDGSIAWSAIRSPVPNFGGRISADADWDAYDEEAEDPQYNLIFIPWDAQFDESKRDRASFMPLDPNGQLLFESAVAHVNCLVQVMEQRYADSRDAWAENCKRNLARWTGDGIRLT